MSFTINITAIISNYQLPPWAFLNSPGNVTIDSQQKNSLPAVFGQMSNVFNPQLTINGEGGPYIDYQNLDPNDNASNVITLPAITVPIGRSGLDMFHNMWIKSGSTTSPPYSESGIADALTLIRLSINTGVWNIIYQNGSGVGGWLVSKYPNQLAGYNYILTPPGPFPGSATMYFEISLTDIYGVSFGPDSSYNFTTIVVINVSRPFIDNYGPITFGVDGNANIFVDILDDYGIDILTLDAYVNSILAFQGPSTFISPWIGATSEIYPITVDDYYGFHLVLDSASILPPSTPYVASLSCKDNSGNLMTTSDAHFSFRTGFSIDIVEVSLYEITLDLTFTDLLKIDNGLLNSSNYIFNNGMYARKVDIISIVGGFAEKIRLWAELFSNNSSFNLQLSSDILDQYGFSIPGSYNFEIISPFISEANISNYNGKIRTGRESELVFADSQRIYLAGKKGIDVFRKQSKTTPVKWAQILDGYEITAMFVANPDGDVIITDADPPFLQDQIPIPDGTMISTEPIQFTIADLKTSIEITSVMVYINNQLIFQGAGGGWSNDFFGKITIGYKKLDFYTKPNVPFILSSVVYVRVIARDLLNNLLDTTYSFTVSENGGEPLFGEGGFGDSEFGGGD